MFATIKLQVCNPGLNPLQVTTVNRFVPLLTNKNRQRQQVIVGALTRWSHASSSPTILTSSVGAPPLSSPSTHRHVLLLNAITCAVAISAAWWVFFSAIPAIVAFRRAAESLEKRVDVATQNLPHTMAAVRLSGMEISDLTMELSDLGHHITKGVRSSTQAVRLAHSTLTRFTSKPSPTPTTAFMQDRNTDTLIKPPGSLRQTILNARAFLHIFFTLSRFSTLAIKFFGARPPPNKP